jgi:hypothetical protein
MMMLLIVVVVGRRRNNNDVVVVGCFCFVFCLLRGSGDSFDSTQRLARLETLVIACLQFSNLEEGDGGWFPRIHLVCW